MTSGATASVMPAISVIRVRHLIINALSLGHSLNEIVIIVVLKLNILCLLKIDIEHEELKHYTKRNRNNT